MRVIALMAATILVAACSKSADAPAEANTTAEANAVNAAAPADANATVAAAGMSHLDTSWEWTDDGKKLQMSVDGDGGYIIQTADGTHVDHGTYAVKDGKDCFTSAMGKMESLCWTAIPETAIGASVDSSSDKGERGTFTRVAYKPLKM